MARSAGDPKVRYIGFRLDSPAPVSRKDLIEAIRQAGETSTRAEVAAAAPWLTRFDGTYGIVRCTHTHVALVRELLGRIERVGGRDQGVQVTLQTVGTSGTIRSLVEKHLGDLQDRGRRP